MRGHVDDRADDLRRMTDDLQQQLHALQRSSSLPEPRTTPPPASSSAPQQSPTPSSPPSNSTDVLQLMSHVVLNQQRLMHDTHQHLWLNFNNALTAVLTASANPNMATTAPRECSANPTTATSATQHSSASPMSADTHHENDRSLPRSTPTAEGVGSHEYKYNDSMGASEGPLPDDNNSSFERITDPQLSRCASPTSGTGLNSVTVSSCPAPPDEPPPLTLLQRMGLPLPSEPLQTTPLLYRLQQPDIHASSSASTSHPLTPSPTAHLKSAKMPMPPMRCEESQAAVILGQFTQVHRNRRFNESLLEWMEVVQSDAGTMLPHPLYTGKLSHNGYLRLEFATLQQASLFADLWNASAYVTQDAGGVHATVKDCFPNIDVSMPLDVPVQNDELPPSSYILSWNVNGSFDAILDDDITRQMLERNDVVLLQETHLYASEHCPSLDGYIVFSKPRPTPSRGDFKAPFGGVATLLDNNGESFVNIPSVSRVPPPGARTPGDAVSNDNRGVPSLHVEHEAAYVERDVGTGSNNDNGQRLSDVPDDERVNDDSRSWNTVPTRRRSKSMDDSSLSSLFHARKPQNRYALTEEQVMTVRKAEANMSDSDRARFKARMDMFDDNSSSEQDHMGSDPDPETHESSESENESEPETRNKGKAVDPRNWGASQLPRQELSRQQQQAELEHYAQTKKSKRAHGARPVFKGGRNSPDSSSGEEQLPVPPKKKFEVRIAREKVHRKKSKAHAKEKHRTEHHAASEALSDLVESHINSIVAGKTTGPSKNFSEPDRMLRPSELIAPTNHLAKLLNPKPKRKIGRKGRKHHKAKYDPPSSSSSLSSSTPPISRDIGAMVSARHYVNVFDVHQPDILTTSNGRVGVHIPPLPLGCPFDIF
ncbi:hypothetical protein E1B28_005207 [Marasmius oreades]|uniref:Uncharacterized protein n=1 Tax=Marasmius oreades TaxID=181124 RepID=A0A9P7V085_9AGAR|nr:uncharacterized protein E1B28_005207 [Marasmius oreades]KAG7097894.1 hypothetical protein E1B28_005207 [Marasmius oreades]